MDAAQFVLTFSNHNIFVLLIDETITTNEKQLLMNGNLLRYEFMHESVRLRSQDKSIKRKGNKTHNKYGNLSKRIKIHR